MNKNIFAILALALLLVSFGSAQDFSTVQPTGIIESYTTTSAVGLESEVEPTIDDVIAEWEVQGEDYLHPLNFQGIYAQRLRFLQGVSAGVNRRAVVDYTVAVDRIYKNWQRPGYDRTYVPVPAFALEVSRNDSELTAKFVVSETLVTPERTMPWDVVAPRPPPEGIAVVGRRVMSGWYGVGRSDTTLPGAMTTYNGVKLTHKQISPFARFWLSDARMEQSFPHLVN